MFSQRESGGEVRRGAGKECRMFLTSQQLAELTGYVRPSAQRRWLAQNGIRFWVRADGMNAVLVDQLTGDRKVQRPKWQPDLSAMDLER